MSFTGAGWLGIVWVPLTFVGGLVLAGAVTDGSLPMAMLALAGTFLLSGILYRLVARSLNSTATPQGRVHHDAHTINGAPMQALAGFLYAIAVVLASIAVGQLATPVLGWVAFAVAIVAIFIGLAVRDQRRQQAGGGTPRGRGTI